jgi:transposase
LRADIAAVEDEIAVLLGATDGQILTGLPGVATLRAAAFAAHSLPIGRFPDAEHLYSATGLAPALYESATVRRRGRISRQGLAEHRDALMGIAWGLSLHSPSFE